MLPAGTVSVEGGRGYTTSTTVIGSTPVTSPMPWVSRPNSPWAYRKTGDRHFWWDLRLALSVGCEPLFFTTGPYHHGAAPLSVDLSALGRTTCAWNRVNTAPRPWGFLVEFVNTTAPRWGVPNSVPRRPGGHAAGGARNQPAHSPGGGCGRDETDELPAARRRAASDGCHPHTDAIALMALALSWKSRGIRSYP
jgi:hypothetical protein